MKDINARLRKVNSKLISILNRNGLRYSAFAKELHRENKTEFKRVMILNYQCNSKGERR